MCVSLLASASVAEHKRLLIHSQQKCCKNDLPAERKGLYSPTVGHCANRQVERE
jgi:hypothetical protein